MKQVIVTNNVTGLQYSSRFNSQSESNIWIDTCRASGQWGDPSDLNIQIIDISSTVDSEEAISFLHQTDWKVIRHRDQLAAGEPTSLTEEQYMELLGLRQEARNKVL